jgi:hypothetical protein
VMKTPDDVAEMLRLRHVRMRHQEDRCSNHSVELAAGGVRPFRIPERRKLFDLLQRH